MKRFALVLLVIGLVGPNVADSTAVTYRNREIGNVRDGLLIWDDPGVVENLDFGAGPGGASLQPQPPFRFLERLSSGTTEKVKVLDAAGRKWVAKWGPEAHAEIITTRIAWACGYFVIPSYFIRSGHIEAATNPDEYIEGDGSFRDARFQLWEESLIRNAAWSWKQNFFDMDSPGRREFNGLKTVMMLTSNWDTKDSRDVSIGCNTAIRKRPAGELTRYEHLVLDWGGSMGRWGGHFSHSKWDCEGFAGESAEFVRGVHSGEILWGYRASLHTGDITSGITVEDVRWLLRFLGRISDDQLRAGVRAAGGSQHEVECFTRSLRARINRLMSLTRPHDVTDDN